MGFSQRMNTDDDDDDDAATMIAPRSAMPFGLQPEEPKAPLPAAGTPAIPHAQRNPSLAPVKAAAQKMPAAPGWVRAYLWTCGALTLVGVGALVLMKLARWW